MKQHFIFGIIAFLLMVLVPLVSLQGRREAETPAVQTSAKRDETTAAVPPPAQSEETIAVLRAATGRTETLGMREYLIGCVAAEMPAGSHLEALKAQAVASYTYARYRLEAGGKQALSDSGASDQGYLSAQERKQRWGENAQRNEDKLAQAVDAVLGQTVAYEGRPILAAYCAVSAGRTESAENYWGDALPYLQSVDSPGDKVSPDYSKTVTLQPEEVKKALKDGKLGKDPSKWFGKAKRSEAGTVLEIEAGGETLTGRELRGLLGLRSANFTIAYKDGRFEVKCLGYGHGVGMSQYGADFMARQGSDYKEILAHYYTGCSLI